MEFAASRVSDLNHVDSMFNSREDTSFREYLRDRYRKTVDYLEKASTGIARNFLDKSKKIFDYYNSEESLRKTRASVRSARNVRNSDQIADLHTLPDLRAAGFRMQRFIMADPLIRFNHQRQLIDGYSETYVDMEPGEIGGNHYDYRRVTNGVYRDHVDGERLVCERHYETLIEGDRELDASEQDSIMTAWEIARLFLHYGIDPTNRLG